MNDNDFDLSTQVQQIISETSLSDPGDIAEKLLENMSAEQLRSVALGLLRTWVRMRIQQFRVSPLQQPAAPVDQSKRRAGSRNSARARHALTAEDRVERALQSPFSYDDVNWGRTGDLSVEQVRSLGATYNKNGNVLLRHGQNWNALADAMVEHGVTRVRDLPADVLLAFFAPEAAAA